MVGYLSGRRRGERIIIGRGAILAPPQRDKRCRITLCHMAQETLFEHAGGIERLHQLEDYFYSSVLADPLLQPLFGAGKPSHVDHLTWFTAESFGGSDRFSRELGFAHLIDVHRHLNISEEQRQRFVALYLAALDAVGMPGDKPFRDAVREHVEFGSRVAMQNSHAATDDELHPLREVPHWTWDGDGQDG